MNTKEIKTWLYCVSHTDKNVTMNDIRKAMEVEISELRNYVKELEDFRDQVSELPEAFKVYSCVIKTPILVDSLSIAQAIQDSIDNTKIVPLYAYTK